MQKNKERSERVETENKIDYFVSCSYYNSYIYYNCYIWQFTYIQKQEIQHYYGIELEGYESLSNSSRILTKLTSDVYETLVNAAQNDVGSFAYEPFLNSTNAELQKQSSYLIVRRDDKILYNGSKRDNVYLTYILTGIWRIFYPKRWKSVSCK